MNFLKRFFPGRQNLVFDFDTLVHTLYQKNRELKLATQIIALAYKVLPSFRQKHFYDHGIICNHMMDFLPQEVKDRFETPKLRHVVMCGIHFYQQVEELLKGKSRG